MYKYQELALHFATFYLHTILAITETLGIVKHVNLHLKSYPECNKLLYYRQSGFRSNHSCQTALIKYIDEWLSAIDNNEIVSTVFIYLSIAFDFVNHDLFLEKLKLYGMHETTIKCFSSYLKDRDQQTYVS